MNLISKLNCSKTIAAGLACSVFVATSTVSAQIVTGRVPQPSLFFLTIAPDARSAGMGDAGVAISPDANATYWNAAKLSFAERDFGASVSYTPWMRNLLDDNWLGYATAYKKIGKGHAVAASVNYYSSGLINLQTGTGIPNGYFRGTEFAFAGAYSAQLSKNFSMGVTLKFINSNLVGNAIVSNVSLRPGRTAAVDLSAFYRKVLIDDFSGKRLNWSFGAVLSNFGGKISYGYATEPTFIPTTLKIGGGLSFSPNGNHQFNFILDASKLAIPSPVNGVIPNNQPMLAGVLKSFSDAPGGFHEEMQEVVWSGGAEYKYKATYVIRTGYFGENKNKGGRKYFTAGAGLRVRKSYDLDLAYLFPVAGNSVLKDTFRISLSAYLNTGKRIRTKV